MAENRITQEVAVSITQNSAANARVTQEDILSITQNSAANARASQFVLLTITNDPTLSTGGGANNQIIIIG